jgi:hypothetical protein
MRLFQPNNVCQDEEKRKKRETRFGASTSKAPPATVDEEEIRKRKAREERFGVRILFTCLILVDMQPN